MLSLGRFYLYAATSWGVAAALGLGSLLPGFLLALDVMPILVAIGILMTRFRRISVGKATLGNVTVAITIFLFILGNFFSSNSRGGSVVLAAQYWGALLRPIGIALLVLTALHTARYSEKQRRKIHRTLLRDLKIVIGIQFLAAACQVIAPEIGRVFIPTISETQSAFAALEEGDVSGFMPNSIDFAYMSVAGFIVLSLESLRGRRRPPGIAVTTVFVFFVYMSGSFAALLSLGIFISWLHIERLQQQTRRRLTVGITVLVMTLGFLNAGDWQEALSAKIENMMLSRLGLLLVTAPQLVVAQPSVLVLGLGPDFEMITGVLSTLPDALAVLSEKGGETIINDVFWFALIISLGMPLAFGYSAGMLYLLWRICKIFIHENQVKTLFSALAVVIVIGGFFNQILLVRSFYTPLLIGLFVLTLRNYPKSNFCQKNTRTVHTRDLGAAL